MGDQVFVASCSGVVFAFDRTSGEVRWSYDTAREGEASQFHGDPVVAEGLLIIPSDASPTSHLYAFELATGKVRWKTPVPPRGLTSHLIRHGTSVLGLTPSGRLISFELATGIEEWSFDPGIDPALGRLNTHPALAGDRLFYGAPDGRVRALDAASGEVIWTADLGARPNTAVTIDGDQLLVGTMDGALHRLALADGAATGRLELPAMPVGTPTLTSDALVLVLGDGYLVSIDRDLGGLLWTYTSPSKWSSFQPLVEGSRVLAGTDDGDLYGFRLDDGGIVFQDKLAGTLRGLGRAGETYYIGTLQGTFYAYSAGDTAGSESDPLSWLAGSWRGTKGDGVIEEIWSARQADDRMGMFRLVQGESVGFYEFMTIDYGAEEGPVLRIKHFNEGLRGWEQPDESEVFTLTASGPREATFAQRGGEVPTRLIYRLTQDGELVVLLEKDREGETSRSEFRLTRQ